MQLSPRIAEKQASKEGSEREISALRTTPVTTDAGGMRNYGYSLFAIARDDLRRLRDLHLEYVRAMQPDRRFRIE